MSDTDTDTSTTDTDNPPTWMFVIYGFGFWACGNTHTEALANAKRHGMKHKTQTPYTLYSFTRPVQNVNAHAFGLQWEWADEVGEHIDIPMNGMDED